MSFPMNIDSLIRSNQADFIYSAIDSAQTCSLSDTVCHTIIIEDVRVDASFLIAIAAIGAFIFALWILKDALSK
jgi:hypothetical protein